MTTCCNCGHPSDQHPEGLRCVQVTETSKERTECACGAYNVRPRPAFMQQTPQERIRVLDSQIRDLDRQIGALQQQRASAVQRRDALTASQAAA